MTLAVEVMPLARGRGADLWANLKTVAYWITLGAAAGGLGGLVVGGIGGRVAMFILRLTSDSSVSGLESDDGFTIVRFDITATAQLLLVTSVMGCIVGMIVVLGRPFFPKRGMPFAWALAGAVIGGAILIHRDGVDFTLLEPGWLAVGMFVFIPALGAGLIAWLVEVYPRFWWRRRGRTILASIGALPAVVAFPIAIAALIVGAAWGLAMYSPTLRRFPDWLPSRITALAVFGLLVILGVLDLARDTKSIV